jgi:glycosyltransferase involved in cell wall biosynthesis
MRVGVFPAGHGLRGGIYQYGLSLLVSLGELRKAGVVDELVVVYTSGTELPLDELRRAGWRLEQLPETRPLRHRLLDPLRALVGDGALRRRWRSTRASIVSAPAPRVVPLDEPTRAWFQGLGVDVMIYPLPTPIAFQAGVPYVMTIHDLQHRLQPEFPEVSANGEWEWREEVFRRGAEGALAILTDSETSRRDVVEFYGDAIGPDRVFVLPSVPPAYLDEDPPTSERSRVRAKYALPPRYLFYPAQFWPHKNHLRIVEALALLPPELDVHVAFAGSTSTEVREQTFADVVARTRELQLEDRVHYLGYVDDDDVAALYAEAEALLMPTFFGPTNIPIVEAWLTGCPVITSNVHGVPEHVGDAAVLVDPTSPESIAEVVERVWDDAELRAELADRGRRRLGMFGADEHRERVAAIVAAAAAANR